MTSNASRTVLIAIIALSLALIACADTRSKGESPAGAPDPSLSGRDGAAVSERPGGTLRRPGPRHAASPIPAKRRLRPRLPGPPG